jgi:cysteine-rich repeat protein
VLCLACDLTKKYLLSDLNCLCMSGFYMNSTGHCLEICGDGKLFYDKCDDGNKINGDGCSSTCKVERRYICFNGSETHQSNCVYSGRDFKITLKWIDKTNG